MKSKDQHHSHASSHRGRQVQYWFGLFVVLLLTMSVQPAIAQTYQVLFRFPGGPGGGSPLYGSLGRDAAGNFYGTASGGSSTGCLGSPCGIVFKVSPEGAETVLHDFTGGTDGSFPVAGAVVDAAGNVYGTTTRAGSPQCQINPNAGGCGTVFKVSNHGKFSIIHSFLGPDGAQSSGNLFLDAKGDLYGTTVFGGNDPEHCIAGPDAGCGVVFGLKRSPSGKWKETVLHSFIGGSDGWQPFATLIGDSAGNIYGTAASGDSSCNQGPADACGVVFKVSPSRRGWVYTVLYVFKGGTDGAEPFGGLVRDQDGNLYGTTLLGGEFGLGTIFKVDPAGNKTIVRSFAGPDGAYPYASLIRDSSGNIYGVAGEGGTSKVGTVFKLDSAGNYTVLHNFTGGTDGAYPLSSLLQDGAGNLYGATSAGGQNEQGTIFKITP